MGHFFFFYNTVHNVSFRLCRGSSALEGRILSALWSRYICCLCSMWTLWVKATWKNQQVRFLLSHECLSLSLSVKHSFRWIQQLWNIHKSFQIDVCYPVKHAWHFYYFQQTVDLFCTTLSFSKVVSYYKLRASLLLGFNHVYGWVQTVKSRERMRKVAGVNLIWFYDII